MSCSEIPEYDLELYQGDDKTFKFRYKIGDIPVDLTDYVIAFECSYLQYSTWSDHWPLYQTDTATTIRGNYVY